MESKKKKQQKKKQRRLLLLLLLLVCSGVLFGTTTYAWFTANKTVTVDPIDVNVEAKSGLQISADGETWKSVISNADLKGASATYTAAVNQIPSMIEPVSTAGAVNEGGKMQMFLGEVSTNDSGDWLLSSTASVEENRTDAGSFVAFDVFLRTEQAGQIYLTTNSGVEFTDEDDTGIKNATRVAFVVLGNTPSDSELGIIQGLNGGTSSPVTIWEPNAGSHTTYGVNNANEVYGIDSLDAGKIDNAPVSYDGIKAEFNIPDEDIYIEADYNRLKQVFINLLKNAIEAKDSSKKENKIKISLESDNNFMKIIIEDNGVGMDKDTLNSVSEMFFTTKKKGSGLGVSLSKEIIEQHGGNIVYNSVKGEGTRVIVTLPKEINMA